MMSTGVEIFSLIGKSALITGATGYLGSAMAHALAEAGAHIFVNSRSEKQCIVLAKKLVELGYSAEPAAFDVTDKQAIDNFFKNLESSPLHILINNAHIGSSGNIESSTSGEYSKSYDISVLAAHNLLNAALPSLRKAVQNNLEASVINISSMYAMVSPDQGIYQDIKSINPPFYGASKAALLQWTRYAACEFGPENIRVNSISPGAFPSLLVQKDQPEFIVSLSKKVPLGRVGIANELKGPVLFLASGASSYINGSNIVIDGGWTCW